ncbi:S-adenosyl-L-methionine-dependent methyltransferase [Ceratobasidium sp. AG-I]|nr:S-adenosyl-L-methionine-dependent methyltransferase [Ceratobasidium sp. AG-I]
MASELKPSKLGKKSYWDEVYNVEVENFETDGDEGEVWFGEETVDKMLEWTLENVPATANPYVLDVGTGNGIMTVTLAENGYSASHLVGIDYSEPSIKLAQSVAKARGHPDIRYIVSDFINEAPPIIVEGDTSSKWDLLLDKGTYDAIALAEKNTDGSSLVLRYPPKVSEALKSGGLFLITSCNFTEEELKAAFGAPELKLTYHSRIQHPTYTFGGRSGSVCSSVAFKKE